MDGNGRRRVRLRITGVVQGVGFRPFVWRRAVRLGLAGWVENDPGGVTAEVEGDEHAVATFVDGLAAAGPPLGRVTAVDLRDLPTAVVPSAGFVILESTGTGAAHAAVVPADVAPCPACLAELADPRDRRFGHAFVSCTDCGPRFTIIDALPYDRGMTSMRAFPMCPACAAEYHSPTSRRFHAQPIACPACGPVVWFARSGRDVASRSPRDARWVGSAALEAARDALRAGEIVAVKGIGGFHLACDATNAAAVDRLRRRKQRPRKPFAVMVADTATACTACSKDGSGRSFCCDAPRRRPDTWPSRSRRAATSWA